MSEELKLYTCHKQVHARPMNRGDYNKLQGWDMPANENGADDGYLVIYNKDTADHYVSWSPKHIFDAGYDEAVVLTEADSLTDLAGTLRPDHPSVASR